MAKSPTHFSSKVIWPLKMAGILAFILLLDGCGRKPASLTAPETAGADAYPQVYPKPQPGEAALTSPEADLINKYRARPEQSLQ
jgi:hypothetical protein